MFQFKFKAIEMDFSNDELPIIAQLLDAAKKKNNRAPHNYWVHSEFNKRETIGKFQTLYIEFIDDETKFYGYFRMSINTFYVLLNLK